MTGRVYAGLATILLGSLACFFSMYFVMYCIIHKYEDLTGIAITIVCVTSAFTLIVSALGMALFKIEAAVKQRRRRTIFGAENLDPDRVQRVELLRWVRSLAPVFSWAWIVATLFYIILCVVLGFTSKLGIGMAFTAFLMGNPMYMMLFNNRLLIPSLVESLEVIAGYATYDSASRSVRFILNV